MNTDHEIDLPVLYILCKIGGLNIYISLYLHHMHYSIRLKLFRGYFFCQKYTNYNLVLSVGERMLLEKPIFYMEVSLTLSRFFCQLYNIYWIIYVCIYIHMYIKYLSTYKLKSYTRRWLSLAFNSKCHWSRLRFDNYKNDNHDDYSRWIK